MSNFQFMGRNISLLRYPHNHLCGIHFKDNHRMKTFADRLKARRKEIGLSQVDLARVSGVSQTTISDIERGRNDGSGRILDLAKALGCRPEWLEKGTGQMLPITRDDIIQKLKGIKPVSLFGEDQNVIDLGQSSRTIPLISWVQAGQFCNAPDLLHPGDYEELIPCPTKKAGRHSYALRVQGDSMVSPFPGQRSYLPGTVIICDPDAVVTNGCRVVARIHSEETATFKVYSEDAGKRYLKPINPQYPIIEMTKDMHICGVVVGSYMDE
jgi:SOS-response transcriptional repressor LexA